MKRFLSLFAILCLGVNVCLVYGQKVKCGGTYPYTYSENISHAEAKARAVENAIIMALADEFGTTVTSQSFSELTNTSEWFAQLSKLQVKGRLLRHIREPEISDPLYGDNLFTINVKVLFYAEPIHYAPIEFEAKVLCNGTEARFESDTFKSGDEFYMLFSSPKDGHLAVFFEDSESVTCILPYYENGEKPFPVRKGEKYVLFTTENNQYNMTCGSEPEVNYVHVLFSPNSFIDGDLERDMSPMKFRKWLANRQGYDEKMQIQSALIKVTPPAGNE